MAEDERDPQAGSSMETAFTPLMALLSAMLFLGKALAPFLLVFTLLCPVPIVLTGLRCGFSRMTAGIAISLFIILLITGSPPLAMVYFTMFAVPSAGMAFFAARGYASSAGIGAHLFGTLAGLAIFFAIAGVTGLEDRSIFLGLDAVTANWKTMLESGGYAREEITALIFQFRLLLPTIMIASLFFFSLGSYYLAQFVISRLGEPMAPLPRVGDFRTATGTMTAFLGGMILARFLGGTDPAASDIFALGFNLQTMAEIGFFASGFALVKHFTDRFSGPPAFATGTDLSEWPGSGRAFMTSLAGALVMMFMLFNFRFCVLMGLADSLCNFRRWGSLGA